MLRTPLDQSRYVSAGRGGIGDSGGVSREGKGDVAACTVRFFGWGLCYMSSYDTDA